MVQFTTLAFTAASLVGLSYAGNAKVTNNCDFDVTAWSTGGSLSGPYTVKANGGEHVQVIERDPVSGGVAIKVTREEDGLFTGDPQTIFSYTKDPDRLFYDLNGIFGADFEGHRVELRGEGDCPDIVWEDGVPPGGIVVRDCKSSAHATLELCA